MNWLIDLLPNFMGWIIHIATIIGVLGMIASFVLNFVPFVAQYRLIIQIVACIFLVFGVYNMGALSEEQAWQAKVDAVQHKLDLAQKQSADLNTKLIEEQVEGHMKQGQIDALNKKYLESIRTKIDQDCKIDNNVIMLHNNAAKNLGVGTK